jgi:hypothetical protein
LSKSSDLLNRCLSLPVLVQDMRVANSDDAVARSECSVIIDCEEIVE